MTAFSNKLAQRAAQKAAAEAEAALTAESKDVALATQQVAEREANLLRQLEQKPPRPPRTPRSANAHEEAKIGQLRQKYKVDKRQNVAYTEGAVDGKFYEQTAHSGHAKDRPGTVRHTPVERQQLETRPTTTDHEIAIRDGKPVDPTRRAHDSEVKMLEDLLSKTTPKSTGNIRLVSERTVCESCSNAIEQVRRLRPGIRVRVSHAVIK